MGFLRRLVNELVVNGKSLLVWLVNELNLTDYPGLMDAINAFLANPSRSAAWHLVFQLLWVGASGHRLIKVLRKVM